MVNLTYRIWLIQSILLTFLPPLATVFLVLHVAEFIGISPNTAVRLGLCLLSTPIFWFIFRQVREWRDAAAARRLGAKMLPKLQGKSWDNRDLIARYTKGLTEGYIGSITDDLLDELGVDTARLSLFGVEKVITRDHHIVKFIASTGFHEFELGEANDVENGSLFRQGIFNSDGEQAKMHRALARPYFARDRISDFETFHRYAEKLISRLKDLSSKNEPIEVQDLFARFSLDTAGDFLFGASDFNTMDMPLPKAGKAALGPKGVATEGTYGVYANAIEESMIRSRARQAMSQFFWTAKEFFHDSQVAPNRVINAYLEPLVKRAYENKQKGPEEKGKESFLDHMARSTDDVVMVRDQLLNMMLAARDTTAALLSFTCYLLAMDPEIMARLRQEVLAAYGTTESPTYENLKQLKYLRAVLNETLRLFPPAPRNARASKGETVIPTRDGPIYIPRRDWRFTWFVSSIHRRKDLWGENAEEFDPDRWLDARAKEVVKDPFRFLAFNAGPRICLGQQFAYNEASFVLVRLLQTFSSFTLAQAEAAPAGSLPPEEWKKCTGRKTIEKIHPQTAIIIYSKGGLWLRMA